WRDTDCCVPAYRNTVATSHMLLARGANSRQMMSPASSIAACVNCELASHGVPSGDGPPALATPVGAVPSMVHTVSESIPVPLSLTRTDAAFAAVTKSGFALD